MNTAAPVYQLAVPSGIVGSFVCVVADPFSLFGLHMAEVEVWGVPAGAS